MNRIAVFVFLLLVSLVSASADTVIYSNDFSTSVADWQTFQPGWVLGNGVYRSTNTSPNVPVESVWANGYGLSDYALSVDMNKDNSHSPSDSQLIFRYQDSQHYGDCRLLQGAIPNQPDSFYLLIVASQGGVLASVPFAFNTNQTYRLAATVSGNSVTCGVVGHPETLISTDSFFGPSSGTAGLRSTHIPTTFDNFEVDAVATPEPATLALVGSGLFAIGRCRRRR